MPRLVCNVTTPQELREEIVSLLLHRSAQQRDLSIVASGIKQAQQREYAATVLGNLAGEVKCMEIVNAWPAGLTETPGKPIADMSEDEFNEIFKTTRRAIDMPSRHFYNK